MAMEQGFGHRCPVVAVDGPAGSGKSTIARAIAERCNLVYIDTGAMYRAMALAILRAGVDPTDELAAAEVAGACAIAVHPSPQGVCVWLDGEDVSPEIRTPEVERVVPLVARYPAVRAALVDKQRALAAMGGVVMDGRDIGTVIAPDAECKLYVTAQPEVRVQRRYEQLAALGTAPERSVVARDLLERDDLDRSRSAGPLRRAEDAIILDTTHLGVEEALAEVFAKFPALVAGGRGVQAGRGSA